MSDDTEKWIEIKDPVHQQQLFAACPVCFLSVAQGAPSDVDSELAPPEQSPQRNVMVISWLIPSSATMGDGDGNQRLFMSMNKRRHTSSMLENGSHFCLSILASGMEELAFQVGSTSGKWGKSKFPQDHHQDATTNNNDQCNDQRNDHSNNNNNNNNNKQPIQMSKRAKKEQRFKMGIPGLYWTALGSVNETVIKDDTVFAVGGTLARVHCQIVSREESVIDEDHYFVVANIVQAFVKESHWKTETNVFGPRDGTAPSTLSFFGSRSFGHVQCLPSSPTTTTNIKNSNESPEASSDIPCSWIRLEDPKQLSRLLYTNPLCWMLLDKNGPGNKDEDENKNDTVALLEVSRITATNNLGLFMFCIEATSKDLKRLIGNKEDVNETKFTLSVPVQGMEALVQTVFEGNKKATTPRSMDERTEATESKQSSGMWDASKIPWEAIRLGANEECGELRYVAGCAAHLQCRVYDIRPSEGATDGARHSVVFFAKMEHALVNSNYWDAKKNRFIPSAGSAPYMKRLGNHTFGYVKTS